MVWLLVGFYNRILFFVKLYIIFLKFLNDLLDIVLLVVGNIKLLLIDLICKYKYLIIYIIIILNFFMYIEVYIYNSYVCLDIFFFGI